MMNSLLSDPFIIIMLVVAALCLGFLFGFLLRGLLKRGSQEMVDQAKPTVKPANRNWDEVAHLWRDRRDGRLIFQVENEYYKRSSDLTPKERDILLRVIMDFYKWLEPTSKIDATQSEPTVDPESNLNQPESATVNIPMPIYEAPNTELKRLSFSPVRMITQALEAEVSTSAIPGQSIVAQIDAILQEKLYAADMQKWAVRLVEFPNRGMVVMVGLEQYDGIEAVPYERVRKMIREAVAEWERRSERSRTE